LTDANMAHFDASPKAVRVALANANRNWNCSQVRRVMTARSKKKKCYTSAEIIDVVRTRDNKLAARYYDAFVARRTPSKQRVYIGLRGAREGYRS
jgi:hypothetical protein